MATAIHVKSESVVNYLCCTDDSLTDDQAKTFCSIACPEEEQNRAGWTFIWYGVTVQDQRRINNDESI